MIQVPNLAAARLKRSPFHIRKTLQSNQMKTVNEEKTRKRSMRANHKFEQHPKTNRTKSNQAKMPDRMIGTAKSAISMR